MSNELIFLLLTGTTLLGLLGAWRLGENALITFIVITYLINSLIISKTINLFGFSTTFSAITYSSIFIATDILTEHHGKKSGYRALFMCLLAALFMVWIQQMVLQSTPTTESQSIHDAMNVLFSTSISFFAVSLSTYFIAQGFDIWLYHFIHGKTGDRMLWLRNNLSTFLSQGLSAIVFGSFAYWLEIFPREQVLEVMISAYVLNLMIAVLDTPIIYLSYTVRGKKIPR